MNAQDLRMLKHELRTPINHIIGYSELLIESAEDDGVDFMVEQASALRGDGQQLAELIESHFMKITVEGSEANHPALMASISAVVERVLTTSDDSGGRRDERFAGDLERIHNAAARFANIISNSTESECPPLAATCKQRGNPT